MERTAEFQLLKLKVASEIVRSSQAAVAFSRAFYLEEVLIDKIGKELRDLKDEYESLLRKVTNGLKTVDEILSDNSFRSECLNIQMEMNGKEEIFEEFEERILQAEARRQAKSSLLQKLSTNELMSKFESLSSTQLRELQVPEFSCFINESDFGILERLNEDWNLFKTNLMCAIGKCSTRLSLVRVNDLSSYRSSQPSQVYKKPGPAVALTIPRTNSELESIRSAPGSGSSVHLEEIGKTFANRSGSVIRKFSTLLRRGKQKSLPSDSFLESSEA